MEEKVTNNKHENFYCILNIIFGVFLLAITCNSLITNFTLKTSGGYYSLIDLMNIADEYKIQITINNILGNAIPIFIILSNIIICILNKEFKGKNAINIILILASLTFNNNYLDLIVSFIIIYIGIITYRNMSKEEHQFTNFEKKLIILVVILMIIDIIARLSHSLGLYSYFGI